MANARGYGNNGQALYANVTKPMSTWIAFTVTPTNGLGVTSVKSNGYANYVFMHTSTTPTATAGITNPNPPSGYAMIGLKNNFNAFLGYRWSISYPAGSTGTTSTTAASVYTITALGTTTTAQWQAVGVPAWVTPAVGVTFVATASQAIGGTGTVGVPGVPNIGAVTVVGDPNTTIASSSLAQYGGAYLLLQFNAATNSSTTTFAPAAPTAASIVRLELFYDGSSVTIDGL
jgi:hypothetical protein